jgi:hypothetical protein
VKGPGPAHALLRGIIHLIKICILLKQRDRTKEITYLIKQALKDGKQLLLV